MASKKKENSMNSGYELIVDGFAGGGGASEGIKEAIGREIDIAINHDPDAIEMHAMNHPNTQHFIENIWKINPLQATGGRPVGLAWFSPDCTHHSRAKGCKPVENKRRGLAWVVVHWARLVHPRVIILENVPEFKEWGPVIQKLDAKGNPIWINKPTDMLNHESQTPYMVPDPTRKGMTFRLWANKLRGLGYHVEWRELSACDYGAPTTRKRLFIIARCDGQPIVWPAATHGKAKGLLPYKTAAECIDWTIPCPSIFNRKKPLAEATLKRIAKGIQKYIVDNPRPFIVGIDNKSSGDSAAWDLFEPLRTVTRENRFALVAPMLAKYHGQKKEESRCYPATEPIRVIDTQNRHALVMAFLTKFYGTSVGSEMLFPMPTITATGQHIGLAQAFIVQYNGTSIGQVVTDPMHAITTKDRFGLVIVNGEKYQIADIGLRMLKPRELAFAQGFTKDYILTGTSTNQVAKIGNSVSPPMAKALAQANYAPMKISERKVG